MGKVGFQGTDNVLKTISLVLATNDLHPVKGRKNEKMR